MALDIVWFVHRMVCTYATARALLYGSAAVVSGQTEEDGEGGELTMGARPECGNLFFYFYVVPKIYSDENS